MQLLPIQREFLVADPRSYNHNSQAVLLTAPAGLDLPLVVEELYRRHDALRLRFVFADGLWQAVQAPLTASMISESCVLETLPEDSNLQSQFIRERCAHYLNRLDITHGPMFRAVYLQGHAEKQGRLFLVIHQLVADDVSWRVLLRDLDAAHRGVSSGGPVQRTTYQQWGEALSAYATSDALQRERDYWHDNCAKKVEPWLVPPLSKEPACYQSVRSVPAQLSVAETTALINDCTATYHTEINELLLCAVYVAMRQWSGQTRVRITLEEHGRENLFPEIDTTETVGCFTTRYPLVLQPEARELSAVIKSVKEQYRAVPHHGIGYGLLRYVAGDEVLNDADPPVLFRYQGELNQVMHSFDPHRLRKDALCLNGAVSGGALRFKLEYSEKQYSKETMEVLAGHLQEALRALIAHSQEADAGYYTPSDFPLATVDRAMLNEWQRTYAIDQLYPATAMQKGMFFHSLLDRAAYVTQLYSTIDGDLQLSVLQKAWHKVIERHAMLRTVFVGDGEEQHQLVIKRVSLPWYEEDLRGMSAEEQSARFEQYRQADRARGFEMTQAPLMRLSLFRLKDDQYRLLWSHHHSLLDGWSIRLVFGEVMQVYAALSEGLKPVLPAVAQYARYVEWSLAQDKEEACRYWETYLADVETVTPLPYDTQARQPKPTHQVQEVSLSAGEMAQLRALAKRYHTTVNTLLQLAWGLVLQRYAGEKEVVFGSVISGRLAEVAEIERMVGLTINSIPVVVSSDGNESLAEAIRHLHSTFQQSQKYGYLPLTEIQKQSRLSRGVPLFESLLVFENYTLDLTTTGANGAGPVRMGEFGANLQDTFPLALSMFQGESLQVLCKYYGDLFSDATISRMLEQFIGVLHQLPNCKSVTDIRLLLSEAEREQVLAWNETATDYQREQTIHGLLAAQAAATPSAVAIEYEDARLSYGELDRRANQLANYLRRQGVGPEVRVGLCVERSLEMVVGLLGILKAGGAYVPLDRDYPLERLNFMIADAQLSVLVTDEKSRDGLSEVGAQVISLDGEWSEIGAESEAEVESGVTADNLAYVIYTSGSTGVPKGVQIPHRAVVNFLCFMQQQLGITEHDVLLAVTSLSFDIAVLELYLPLMVGARVVLLTREQAMDAALLSARLETSGASLMQATPATWRMLIESGWRAPGALKILCGGEALSRELAQQLAQSGSELWNLYGPTETTVWSLTKLIRAGETRVTIGHPLANTQVYVLDQQQQPVPVSVAGELYLGGEGLARGYLQRPALTAERFVPDAFSNVPGARLYRTGDLVRYLANGELDYLGRLDQQVKVRGYRIELGEIEARLEQHALVRQCVVTAPEDSGGNKRLVAYIVGEPVTTSELRTYLKEQLPEYMVPGAFVYLAALPLTANGKVDRKRLPAAEGGRAELVAAYVAPRTAEEELLAGIWAEVLGVERLSMQDNFFERGGHSLLATQVVSRVRALFGMELPVRAMFDTATLAELAQLIVAQRQAETASSGPAIERRSRQTAPALSYAQQRLWFLDQFEPESLVYNVPAAIYLTGELDRAALAQSLSEIARRHEVLRTSFPSVDGQPLQHIAPPTPIDLPLIDFQALTEQDKEILEARYSTTQKVVRHDLTFSGLTNIGNWGDASAQQLAAEEAARPFDLAHGPLWRVALLRLAEQEHVLLLTMHHIVTDGWSLGVLLRELTTLYEAYSRQETSPLAELPIQYADYAEWQREWLRGAVLEEQMGYWREQLAGSSGVLELPADHARPPVQSNRGSSLTVPLGEELTRGLRELSRGEGVTLFMTLLTGWQTLLARYSGQWDLNVGTPIANRTRSEVEGLIGFFMNALVLRTQLAPEMSFREQLQQVREVCLGAYAHQDVPFEMVVEELQPTRDTSRSPLFQVMFMFQNAPLGEFEMPTGLKLQPLAVELDTTRFDLTLALMERETGLVAWCNYRTDLFEETTIVRMLDHWQVLLEAAVADSGQSLSALPLLSEAEREQVLEWNETATDYQREQTIHGLLAAQAAATPSAVAIEYEDARLSYGELDRRANQLANYLRRQGVGPEVRVGLCVERSLEMVVGLLGILKAGGAYVPLDRDYPLERLNFMIADAQLSVLVTDEKSRDGLSEVGAQVISLDGEWSEIGAESEAEVESGVTADNLAYVIYTSGSTGVPKGVQIPHRAVVNFLCFMQQQLGITEHDVLLAVTSLSFDIAVLELYLPLMVGARVVLLTREQAMDAALLSARLETSGASLMQATPATWRMLIESGWRAPGTLKILCGGEALSRELAQQLAQSGSELWNLYGPTETTVWSLTKLIRAGETRVTIGHPLANTQVYVLDQQQQPVPVSVAGELYLGGEGLARGYLQRPALTAERFVPDAFSTVPGARLYRTGDLVRYLANGELDYLGRLDQQVKVRGYRIELGEIEARLEQHALVRQCVVTAPEDSGGNKRLVAYIVGEPVTTSELRTYLKEQLPEYMVPGAFVYLAALPLTANGKVDRKRLPAAEGGRAELVAAYVAPRTAEEELLAGIWAEVLGVERLSMQDNFFERGGHSLLATQVVSRVRALFGIELPLRAIFDRATLAELAQLIVAQRQAETASSGPAIERRSRETAPALSYAQQRLWFLDQLMPESALYNVPTAINLTGELDRVALAQSLSEIARRHEVLRTSFPSVDGQPVQHIAPPVPLDLPLTDLQAVTEESKAGVVRQMATEEAERPFDLAQGPLWRVALLQLGEQEHVLLLTMHHIVTDGWSVGVLLRELTALYEAYRRAEASPLAELPVQYADFAEWQREWLSGAVLEEQMGYWREQLAGSSGMLELPTDHARTAVQSHRGASRKVQLSAELTRGLRELSQREGVTLFMTLLSGWQRLLASYSGQWDLNVGTPIANRTRGEVEGLIGFFVNTLVLRTRLDAEMSFREQLQQVREVCLGAYAHQDVPFEMVVEELQPGRDTSRSPLFQVMFVMQNALQDEYETPAGLKLEPLSVELETTKWELTLRMMETETGLVGWCNYRTELFEETTIARMLDHWQVLLEAAVADPEGRVLPYLTEREERMLIEEWNETSRDYPREECVHELFERQAALTPEAVAVRFEEDRLTYAELNLRAERLACRLRALGVGPETFVGLLTERTPGMLTGLLAVLKAGGAYVPLDPSWPKERLALILADISAPVLLTEEHFANELPECDARIVPLDAVEEDGEVLIEDPSVPRAHAKNPAYVIYTSGSTGRPKGVVVEHRQIVNYVRAIVERARFEPEMTFAMVQPLTVDSTQTSIFPAFLVGGTIHLVSRDRSIDPVALAEYFEREPIDCLKIAPSHLAALQTGVRPEQLMPRRRLIVGGEASRREWLEGLARLAPDCTVFNHYGPTETTVGMLTYKVHTEEVPRPTHVVPMGLPLANATAYVLDRHLRPVAVGVSGELYIGGECVARGYLNRPGMTAEKFVPDPYSSEPGARLYKTGDVVRRLADGNLLFIGRDDQQVKIRGFRIELGEIEAALTHHARVGAAVVIAREETSGDRRLIGYVVPSEPRQAEGLRDELREYLRKKLPDFMVPSALVVLDSLPLSEHGKLDVRRLPAPDAESVLTEQYVAPRNEAELQLACIWEELLGVQPISVNDNFFERGGHSLMATQVVSRIRALFGIDLPLRAMFDTATLAELAELIKAQRYAEADSETENLLAELEALSEEEAQSLVAGHGAQS